MRLEMVGYIIFVLLLVFVNDVAGKPIPITCGSRTLIEKRYSSRIVGGNEAFPGSWPWLVSIQRRNLFIFYQHFCGGSILNVKWVITAAHCFKDKGKDVSSLRLVFGAHQLSKLGPNVQIRRVSKMIEHQKYSAKTASNDIALLRVDQPISFNEFIQPACLPIKSRDIKPMSDCYIAGWGVLKEKATHQSDVLQEARTTMIANKVCNSRNWYNGAVGIHNICGGYERGGIDSCQGDSGGPLMCKEPSSKFFSVVGITSWGTGCGRERKPGVYTSTQHYLDWIRDKIAQKI
ncbi:acrosin-like [Pseudophryne corroboree]|uniref:acrosin-like n=1 Tax=Pseudophryne corroboree TaxID=495146 RepID=UPI0030818EF9